MRFEVSERVRTRCSQEDLLRLLEAQVRKISERAVRHGAVIEASAIQASFGSINRSDTTYVSASRTQDGWLLIADVHYRPSVAFWIFLILGLFTSIFWLLPIAFYVTQKDAVKEALQECFRRVNNEFDQAHGSPEALETSGIANIEKLASLKDRGLITEGEFEAKKKQFLGI